MNRRPHDDVLDLPSALSWVRKAWATLPIPPDRIHARDIEDGSALGSHRFSAAMWRILTSSAYAVHESVETVQCNHNRLTTASAFDCIDCHGNGFYEHRVIRYRWPMSAALVLLAQGGRLSKGTPSRLELVMALAYVGWNPDRAAALLGMPIVSADHRVTVNAMFLMALRRLRDLYSEAPIRDIAWTDKSLSQQVAEDAA